MRHVTILKIATLLFLALLIWDCQPVNNKKVHKDKDKTNDQELIPSKPHIKSMRGDTLRPRPVDSVISPQPTGDVPFPNNDPTVKSKIYRLVGILKCIKTYDNNQFNDKDEILLDWQGLEFFKEVEDISRPIRPVEGRDIYEMGQGSNDSLSFLLLQTALKGRDSKTGAKHVVNATIHVHEQHNAQIPALQDLLKTGITTGEAYLLNQLGSIAQQAAKGFKEGITALFQSYEANGSTPLGAINVTLSLEANKPVLKTTQILNTESRIDPVGINDNDVTYKLRQGSAEYILRLRLEEVSGFTKPVQRMLFIAESEEQCSKDEVIIQTIGNAVTLKRGQTKRFFIPREKFWWYCENARGEANLKAYYIEAKKELNGSSIKLRGFRLEEDQAGKAPNGLSQIITAKGLLPPTNGRKYIEDTHEACNHEIIMVESSTGFVSLRKGESKAIEVPSNRIWYYCGGVRDWITAPVNTNFIQVTRSTGGAFSITCYQNSMPTLRNRRFIESTHDACDDDTVTIQSLNGTVALAKGESKAFFIASLDIWFYCGNSRVERTLPDGTNYVIVTRSLDEDFTWDCYQTTQPVPTNLKYLGSTHEASNESQLIVQTSSGSILVNKRKTVSFWVPSNTYWWYSGPDREHTTTPIGTNYVVLTRSSAGAMTWACYKDLTYTPQMVYKGETHDECGRDNISIKGLRGNVVLAKGQTKGISLASNVVKWWCGDSDEEHTLPAGTNFVYVTRSFSEGSFSWACYYKRP